MRDICFHFLCWFVTDIVSQNLSITNNFFLDYYIVFSHFLIQEIKIEFRHFLIVPLLIICSQHYLSFSILFHIFWKASLLNNSVFPHSIIFAINPRRYITRFQGTIIIIILAFPVPGVSLIPHSMSIRS